MPPSFDEHKQGTASLQNMNSAVGFTSFLESLVQDDEFFASDDVAARTKQHTPSQPSKSIPNQIQTVQCVPEHACGVHSGANVVKADASVLTEAEKLENVRAKNR